ncbi:type II secretion system minor pseudopilin GspK [Desulfurivibrio dismutans]|uniref:type II secretion system minor pseudopilin GspK n=1 Tax=Desulfurivibrio dismutans TaxID=1398908 RepID=UPI0023DA9302|nr:type II secretion system minor pseudopilin GspK [Desulfurivibrio alkaliphilus]MDF1613748.1 type II secretion system minor pseudopilin GspK [Desulfurivibrio alkaliphilus]
MIAASCGAAGRFRNERGAALISALLAAALVASVAAAMISAQQLDIRRTGNIIHGDQAYLYARGVESWAGLLLGRAAEGEEYEYLGHTLPPIPVEGGHLSVRVDDLQGLFNVNNLVLGSESGQEHQRLMFRRLLRYCGLEEELEQAVSDWLDADQEPRFPGGAEDGEYLRRNPPYRTADRPLTDADELALVYGFEHEGYEECLKPLLTALPEVAAVNVNTAPAPVLAALAEGIDPYRAEQLVADRPEMGYTMAEFLEHPALAGTGLGTEDGPLLTVQGRYFMVQSEAVIGQSRVMLHSLLQREGENVRTLQRSR